MSLTIQQSTEFSPASVQFSKLRKNKNGGKAVYLNAGDNKKIYVQFPFMRSPYGLSAFTDEGTGRTSYSLDLSFDPDNTEAMELHDKLKELDDIIVNTVAANSKEWLGKEFNVAVLKEALYKPMVRPGKEQYPATILELKDGSSVVGRLTDENEENYYVSQNPFAPDQIRTVAKANVISKKISEVSTMLPGMINSLNEEELKDLMAYLISSGNPDHEVFKDGTLSMNE